MNKLKEKFEELIGGAVAGEHWTGIWHFIETEINKAKAQERERIISLISKRLNLYSFGGYVSNLLKEIKYLK